MGGEQGVGGWISTLLERQARPACTPGGRLLITALLSSSRSHPRSRPRAQGDKSLSEYAVSLFWASMLVGRLVASLVSFNFPSRMAAWRVLLVGFVGLTLAPGAIALWPAAPASLVFVALSGFFCGPCFPLLTFIAADAYARPSDDSTVEPLTMLFIVSAGGTHPARVLASWLARDDHRPAPSSRCARQTAGIGGSALPFVQGVVSDALGLRQGMLTATVSGAMGVLSLMLFRGLARRRLSPPEKKSPTAAL
jgi:fucose permease